MSLFSLAVSLWLSGFFGISYGASVSGVWNYGTEEKATTSVMGGSILEITGEGFNPSGSSSIEVLVGSWSCSESPYLRTNSRIVCTIGEEQLESKEMSVSVYVDGELAECQSESGCTVEASESQTPFAIRFYPRFITEDETFSITGLFQADSFSELLEVSTAGLRLIETSDTSTMELGIDQLTAIYMKLPSDLSSKEYSINLRGGPGTGYAHNESYFGDADVVLVSRITSLSHSQTTPYGLQLEIKGSSFNSDDQQLFLGEVECKVSSWSSNVLKALCLDESEETWKENQLNTAGFGVLVQRFSEIGELIEEEIIPSFEERTSSKTAKEIYTAFLRPEHTAIHSFFFKGNSERKVKFLMGSPVTSSEDLEDIQYFPMFVYSDSKNDYKIFLSKDHVWKYKLAQEDIDLTEGSYYPIKVVRDRIDSVSFFSFGFEEYGQEDAPNCLPLGFEVSLKKEEMENRIIQVDIFNVKGGRWQMTLETENSENIKSSSILWNVGEGDLTDTILNEFSSLTIVTREMLTQKGQVTSDENAMGGYRFTIEYYHSKLASKGKLPLVEDTTLEAIDQDYGAQISLTLLQKQTEPVSGEFRLFIESTWTNWMPASISPENLWIELQSTGVVGTRTKVTAMGSSYSGFTYTIEFYDEESSKLKLAIDSTRLNTQATLTKESSYDCNWAEYDAIPFQKLYQLSKYPNVFLKSTEGGGSICFPGYCDLRVAALDYKGRVLLARFEFLSDSANSGTLTVTLSKQFLNSDSSVSQISLIMDKWSCKHEGLLQGISEAQCKLSNVVAGKYSVYLEFDSLGFIKPYSDSSNAIVIKPTLSDFSITPGYSNSGVYLEVTGSHFEKSSVSIHIGNSYPCEIEKASSYLIGCLAYAPLDTFLDVFITMNNFEFLYSDAFYFEATSVPSISSLSQRSSSPVEQTYLYILGENFGDSVELVSVDLIGFSDNGHEEICSIVSITDSEIYCYVNGCSQGKYHFIVSRKGYGSSETSKETSFTIYALVSSLSSSSGSYAGGTRLQITGTNFSPSTKSTQVSIKAKDATVVGDCFVYFSNSSLLECETSEIQNEKYIDTELTLSIKIQNKEISAANEETLLFVYSTASTPLIKEVNTLQVSFGSTIKLFGTGFTSRSKIIINNEYSDTVQVFSDQIERYAQVKFPAMEAGSSIPFEVYVPGKGYALKLYEFTFNNEVTVDEFSLYEISKFGGRIVIFGNGFSNSQEFCFGEECSSYCASINFLNESSVACVISRDETESSGEFPLIIYNEEGEVLFDCREESEQSKCTLNLRTSLARVIQSINQTKFSQSSFGLSVSLYDESYVQEIFSDRPVSIVLFQDLSENTEFYYASNVTRDQKGLEFNGSFSSVAIGVYSLVLLIRDQGLSSIQEDAIKVSADSEGFSGSAISNYFGGVQLEITFDNETIILPDEFEIKICGNSAPTDDIGESTITVTVPSLQSLSFLENGLIAEYPEVISSLDEDIFLLADSETSGDLSSLVDNLTSTYYYSANSICYVGFYVDSSHQFLITSFSFYLSTTIEIEAFEDVEVQMSSDGALWSTVTTLKSSSIIPGWNIINWESEGMSEYTARFLRIYDETGSSHCSVTDLVLVGVLLLKESSFSTDEDYSTECSVTLEFEEQDLGTLESVFVEYTLGNNYTVESVKPAYSEKSGGQTVNLTFNREVEDKEVPSVKFMGVDAESCEWTDSLVLSCVTGAYEKTLFIDNIRVDFSFGSSFTKGLPFAYYSLWSDPETWDGESPGSTDSEVFISEESFVILNEDSNVLSSLVVEGTLMFASDLSVALNVKAVTVTNGGVIKIGSASSPRSLKGSIVFYKDDDDSKGTEAGVDKGAIYCNGGKIEIYGEKRQRIFTNLEETAEVGDKSIKLAEEVDWSIGEVIVIGSTSHDPEENEEREISSVSSDGMTVSFKEPLEFDHLSFVETFNGTEFHFRGEVGLLNRSIVIKPDDLDGSEGPRIIITESCSAEIVGVQIEKGGQDDFGGNAVSFVRIKAADSSFIKNSTISNTFGKGVSIRSSYFVTIDQNFFYNTEGPAIALETGFEEFNTISSNLIVLVQETHRFSFLQETEAFGAILLKNPLNYVEGNTVVASMIDAFHYEFPGELSSDGFVFCPSGMKLGSFLNNVAHSCKGNGLVIQPKYNPRLQSCLPPKSGDEDILQTTLSRFLAYKNQENGVFIEKVGAVSFSDFALVENGESAFNVQEPLYKSIDTWASLANSVLVGVSSNNHGDKKQTSSAVGFWGPKTLDFLLKDVVFANYFSDRTAISTCSECQDSKEIIDASTILVFRSLLFENTEQKVHWFHSSRDILKDEDGSLTGIDGGGWVSPYFVFNKVKECQVNQEEFDGLVCDSSVSFSIVKFSGVEREANFENDKLKIVRISELLSDISGFSPDDFGVIGGAEGVWKAPMIVDSSYNLHFSSGIDLEEIQFESVVSETLKNSQIFFQFNFTSSREKIESSGSKVEAKHFPSSPLVSFLEMGDYTVDTKRTKGVVVLSLEDSVYDNQEEEDVHLSYLAVEKCEGVCGESENKQTYMEKEYRYWSDPDSWSDGVVPGEGSRVKIKPSWRMVLDVEDTGNLESLEILGSLYVSSDVDSIRLSSEFIYIRENSQFLVGDSSSYYQNDLTIELYGDKESTGHTIGKDLNGFNKLLMVSGNPFITSPVSSSLFQQAGTFSVYSSSSLKTSFTRLAQTLSKSSSSIVIRDADTQWEEGDVIVIAASNYFQSQTEVFKIKSISGTSISLNTSASYSHYGSSQAYATFSGVGTVDLAAEVGLLSRNVKIQGSYNNDEDDWGGQLLNAQVNIGTSIVEGVIDLHGVEFVNMGQYENARAGIAFFSTSESINTIQNCSIHSSNGYWMQLSDAGYIRVSNNVFYKAVQFGIIFVNNPFDSSFSNNLLLFLKNSTEDGSSVSEVSCLACWNSPDSVPNGQSVSISNNIFADADVGLIAPGAKCTDSVSNAVSGNIFHSLQIGMLVLDSQDEPVSCVLISDVVAYKNTEDGVVAYTESQEIYAESMIFVANKNGLTLNQGVGSQNVVEMNFKIKNSVFIGYTNLNDADESDISGLRIPVATEDAKGSYPNIDQFPFYRQESPAISGALLTIEECTVKNHAYSKNVTFMQSSYFAAEGSAVVHVKDSSFSQTIDSDLVYFSEEKFMDCRSGLNCTGYSNILIRISGFKEEEDFDIVPYASQSTPQGNFSECSKKLSWAGYKCFREGELEDGYVLLYFKSLDDDHLTSDFAPVYIEREEIDYFLILNSGNEWFSNELFDSWLKETSFQAILPASGQYQLYASDSYPKETIYSLKSAQNEYQTIILEILMDTQQFITVKVDGEIIETNLDGEEIELGASGLSCGMNSYQEEASSMIVVLTTGCEVELGLDYFVSIELTFDISLFDFYDFYGVDDFMKTVAEYFDKSVDRFQVLSVQEGSTIIEFVYLYDSDSDTIHETMASELYLAALKGLIEFPVELIVEISFDFSDSVTKVIYQNQTEIVYVYTSDTIYETEEGTATETDGTIKKEVPVWGWVVIGVLGTMNISFGLIFLMMCFQSMRQKNKLGQRQKGKERMWQQAQNGKNEHEVLSQKSPASKTPQSAENFISESKIEIGVIPMGIGKESDAVSSGTAGITSQKSLYLYEGIEEHPAEEKKED